MNSTFKLQFHVDEDCEISLSITYLSNKETYIIPPEHWPVDDDDLERVALCLFPLYASRIKRFHLQAIKKEKALQFYNKKLVPDLQSFEVESKSTIGKFYTISVVNSGTTKKIHCSCPDYLWRRRKLGTHCTHIIDWVQDKKNSITDQFAAVPKISTYPIPILKNKTVKTLLTGDVSEACEDKFQKQMLRYSRQLELKKKLHQHGPKILS